MATTAADSPKISVSLSIDPPRIVLRELEESPTISLTATLPAPQPITIFTWPTIFHLELSQQRANFTCIDLNSNTFLHMDHIKGPKRPGFSRTKGGRDDRHFQTLDPDAPTTFRGKFGLACPATPTVEAGHRYRLSLSEGQKVSWWRYGRKDEVMAPPRVSAALGEPSGGFIYLDMDPVEFDVE